jgi:hypothetical protein
MWFAPIMLFLCMFGPYFMFQGLISAQMQRRQEAHRFNSTYIGTEHLLLGVLLTGSGEATIALFQQGITVDDVRNQIVRIGAISRHL